MNEKQKVEQAVRIVAPRATGIKVTGGYTCYVGWEGQRATAYCVSTDNSGEYSATVNHVTGAVTVEKVRVEE